jgi:hypothetical protein
MPTPTTENPTPYRPLLFLELVSLGTHPIDVGEHSFQQGFRRGGGYPSPLKLPDFAALPMHLDAHPFDFGSEVFEVWHGWRSRWSPQNRTKNEQRAIR